MLRALCLDLMDTVVCDPYVEALEAATGLDLQTAHRLKDPGSWPAFELGTIDEAEFARRYFADPDGPHRFDLEAFNKVRRDGYRFVPGMAELLDELAGRVERHIASNYPVWIEQLCADLAVDQRVEGVHASHHLGARKPDPTFYQRLLDRLDLPAGACLFVDDRAVNCRAAAAAGLKTHRFDGADGLRRRLRADGVLPAAAPEG